MLMRAENANTTYPLRELQGTYIRLQIYREPTQKKPQINKNQKNKTVPHKYFY
jgi:hypothetical protein